MVLCAAMGVDRGGELCYKLLKSDYGDDGAVVVAKTRL